MHNKGNVTHILHVEVRGRDEGHAILEEIHKTIANTTIVRNVYGISVPIMWRPTTESPTSFYHADVPMFTDIVIKRHTQQVMQDVLTNLKALFDDPNGTIAFLVSKPLSREIAIANDDGCE